MTCSSLEKSIQFYNLFGFILHKSYSDSEVNIVLLKNKNNQVMIELFEFQVLEKNYGNIPEETTDIRRIGLTHFAIIVDRIERMRNQCIKLGFLCSSIRRARISNFRYFFVRDPDSNQVECIEEERA